MKLFKCIDSTTVKTTIIKSKVVENTEKKQTRNNVHYQLNVFEQ